MWTIFLAAFGLWLLFEGVMYAAAPDTMKQFGAWLSNLPEAAVRQMGLLSMALGGVLFYAMLRFGGG